MTNQRELVFQIFKNSFFGGFHLILFTSTFDNENDNLNFYFLAIIFELKALTNSLPLKKRFQKRPT